MLIAQLALAFGAFAFAFFGLWLFARPQALNAVDIPATSSNARSEIRAMYGGLELGIAAFLVLCIVREEWMIAGLWFQLLALAGIAAGRISGILIEGGHVHRLLWLLALLEASAALLTLAALVLQSRQ